jgi:hypothetical protein
MILVSASTVLFGCTKFHALEVSRYETTTLMDNARADLITSGATFILRTVASDLDWPCERVIVRRRGDVGVFTTGDGSIDSGAELNAVIALPGQVKVVNQINYCAGLKPGVGGCRKGDSFVVIIMLGPSAPFAPPTWLHEIGHTQGLDHRAADDPDFDPDALMNEMGRFGNTSWNINQNECLRFRNFIESISISNEPVPQALMPIDARDFVRKLHVEGVPYREAVRYGADVVTSLAQMLDAANEQPHWSNVVVTLGIIGNEPAVDHLLAFLNTRSATRLSENEFRAVTSAITSLGYAVNRTKNQKALDYLKEGAGPDTWEGIRWTSPFHETAEGRNVQLSTAAILGLGLTGDASAAALLRSLLAPPATDSTKRFQAQAGDAIAEALKANATISSVGLLEYYRSAER